MKKILMIWSLLFIFFGCVEESTPVSSTESLNPGILTGVVDGTSWTLIQGRVISSKLNPGEYTFDFWGESLSDICDDYTYSSERSLFGSFKLEEGEVSFDNLNNITIFYDNTNLVATTGRLVITKIESDKVTGYLAASYNSANEVTGEFELTKCD